MAPPVVQSGLVTREHVRIEKIRRFPLTGEIRVKVGQRVTPDTLLGYHSAEEKLHVMRIEVHDARLQGMLVKQPGDLVKRGETVFLSTFFAGLGLTEYCSPVDGTIVSIDTVTGTVVIREFPEPLSALFPGVVSQVIGNEAVAITSNATYIEASHAAGESNGGPIVILAKAPDARVAPSEITYRLAGRVPVLGSECRYDHLMACLKARVRGVIAGGVDLDDLSRFSGFVEGLTREEFEARYGASHDNRSAWEDDQWTPMFSVIITEGYGRIPIRPDVFRLLAKNEGRYAFLDVPGPYSKYGEPPQILIPEDHSAPSGEIERRTRTALRPGLSVRLIGSRRFGQTGILESLSGDAVKIGTGEDSPSFVVRLDSGEIVTVPQRNIEIIERA